jgi:hypothetical protein
LPYKFTTHLVIISCLETQEERRNYMLAAMENGMVNPEYVHFFIQSSSNAFGDPPFWVGNDGRDADIQQAAKTVLIVGGCPV